MSSRFVMVCLTVALAACEGGGTGVGGGGTGGNPTPDALGADGPDAAGGADALVKDAGLPDGMLAPSVDVGPVTDGPSADGRVGPIDASSPVTPDASARGDLGPPADASPPAAEVAVPPPDAATMGSPDVARPDAALPDAALPDAAPPDAALPDAALPDAALPDAALPPPGPPPCEPALTLHPADTAALPLDLRTFEARGGTGHYRFHLDDPEQGGLVNLLTGAYLSGETVGTVDRIRLTDTGCAGEAVATVEIVAHLTPHPGGGTVATGTAFTFEVEGGSGALFFSMFGVAGSGGGVSPTGDYQAGPNPGTDRIRLEDLETGESLTVVFDVQASAALTAAPRRLAMPVGARFRPQLAGGTGEYVFELQGDGAQAAAHLEDAFLVGDAPGTGRLHVRDPFAGTEIDVPWEVVAPLHDAQPRTGDSAFFPVPAAPGDVDGDGWRDAVLGVSEADVTAVNSGAVYVYRGGPAGLDPTPARVLAGTDRREEYGRGVATADFDGDGHVDLAVGAPAADVGAADAGAVYLYRGEAGGFFAAEPSQVLSSRVGSDRTGNSVAFCDFNGDGRLDLAVGAHLAEDRTASPVATDQGAVFVWLGYPDGFTERPDQRLYGQFPDGVGGWRAQPAVRFGTWVSVGDFDGDGLCDLVGTSTTYGSVAPRTADGYALLFRGVPPGPLGPGGLALQPSRAWAGLADTDANASFGRVAALGDLDRDGFADLVVGQLNHDRVAGRDENQGAIRIYRGGPLPADEPSSLRPAETADWTVEGDNPGDQFGIFVAIGDADGDGAPDLVAGNWRDELVGGTADVGLLAVYAGRAGELPNPLPTRLWAGRNREERLGTTVAMLGDVDGDGTPDLLSHLGRANEEGFEVGAPVFLSGAVDRPMALLTNPGEPAGEEVGRSVESVGDLDGDGYPELAVGVANGDSSAQGVNAGYVALHRGTASGPDPEPFAELRGHAGHSGSDNLGVAVSRPADFDGDGVPDFAVLARNEDRPASFAAGYAGEAACAGAVPDAGGVFVYRGGGLPPASPAAVWFVPSRGASAQALSGALDINNDGLADLVAGGELFDNTVNGVTLTDAGWFGVLFGRPLLPGAIRVLCDQALDATGLAAGDGLGRAVAAVGDLDADGCDEFAVAAYREASGGRAGAGVVRLFRGFGGPGCPAGPEYVALTPGVANENAGLALAGGGDVDGDGVPELVVGAPGHVRGAIATGAAYVLPGAWLRTLTWRPYVAGQAPVEAVSFGAAGGAWRLEGDANGERFGQGLALVPPPDGESRWGVAVGGVVGEFNGVARSGGVRVYRARADATGMDPVAVAALGGETGRVLSRFGESVAAARFGPRIFVIVGAPEASANSLDAGAVYAFPVW